MRIKEMLRLDIFSEEGAPLSGAAEEESGGAEKDETARREEFERLITGEYKDLYDERAQKMINRRFRDMKETEEKLAGSESFINSLLEKSGAATREELSELFSREDESPDSPDALYVTEGWFEDERRVKAIYPGFSLKDEATGPQGGTFMTLLVTGTDMMDAYEFVHRDEIIGSAMKYTADKIREMTLKDIQQRGLRPDENGLSGGAAGTTRPDPSRWTDDEIDLVVARAKNGEKIIL